MHGPTCIFWANLTPVSIKARIVQELAAYVNGVGGAYILIETREATPLPPPVHVRTITGPVLSEVVQAYDSSGVASSLRQRIRLYSFGQTDTIEVSLQRAAACPLQQDRIS